MALAANSAITMIAAAVATKAAIVPAIFSEISFCE
jgi:hypothetical protein